MRPFRFGFTGGQSSKRAKLLESARTVEALGYSTYGLADHFVRPFAPLVAGQAVALRQAVGEEHEHVARP